jgi:hypothetical protein
LGAVNLPHAVALAILYGYIFMTEKAMLAHQKAAELEWMQRHVIGELGVVR